MLKTIAPALLVALGAVAVGPALAASTPADRPLEGDTLHGEALLKKSGATARVDGAWLNALTDEQALVALAKGAEGFPRVESANPLDRWDALAFIRSRNTDLRDLVMGANTVLLMNGKLDENAEKRLTEQAKVAAAALEPERRVFGLYKLPEKPGDAGAALAFVGEKENKKRDKLKKNTKVGYVVFVKLPGFRDGKYEAAFAVDKDIHIQHVAIRAPDGAAPVDLNQAAARFLGKGARGQYAQLKAGGAGKAIGELEKPLSDAFLMGMEAVYMFEVKEREYFAFDD
jgi:hypothetical protein